MSVVNFNTKKKPTYLCDFICHRALGSSVVTVTQEQVASILLTMGSNKEEDAGNLSVPQPFDQTSHLRLMVGLFCEGPRVKFEFEKRRSFG